MADKIRTSALPERLESDGWFLPTDYVIAKSRFRQQLLDLCDAGAAGPMTVLDVNAGTHGPGLGLVARGHRYVAAEPNPDVREALRGEGIETLDWTPPWLPVEPMSQDLILSLAFLEHLPTWHAALQQLMEFRKALKPGGRLLVVAPNALGMGRTFWDDFKHGWVVTPKRLHEMAEEVGLSPGRPRYTLGWITILNGPLGVLGGLLGRSTVGTLNFGPLSRALEAVGLGELSAKVRKTVFELTVMEMTRQP